jgi:hypothetical protein
MKMYELMLSLKQPGNRKNVKIQVQAPDQITAKQLVQASYAGSDTRIVGGPKEIKQKD